MELDVPPMRIGEYVDGHWRPFEHPHRYRIEETSGPSRLCIASRTSPAELLATLAQTMPEPVFVMVMLRASRIGAQPGRYDHGLIPPEDAAALTREFADFINGDSRFNYWVGVPSNERLLVLDEHGYIYAYGPVDDYRLLLAQRGLIEGDFSLPFPHFHGLSDQFDPDERRLLDRLPWRYMPLMEGDED